MNPSKLILSMMLASSLCACGGGGGDSAPADGTPVSPTGGAAAVPQGLYLGTADDDRSVVGLVLSDGTYYFIYSPAGQPATAGGVVQGTGSVSSGRFVSSDAHDFSIQSLRLFTAQLSAGFTVGSSLSGTLTYDTGDSLNFTTTYSTDYEKVPTAAAIAGGYVGNVAFSEGSEGAEVNIGANGVLTATGDSGCHVTGGVVPRTDGNVYDLTITFGAAPCLHAGETFHGIAYIDSANRRLYAAAPDAARDDGVLFIGTPAAPVP